MTIKQVVEFIISDGMDASGQLHRVKKNFTVRFIPNVSLIGKYVRFFINYPSWESPKFNRNNYRELTFVNPTLSQNKLDCFDNYFELSPLPVSGSFHFCFTTDGSVYVGEENKDGNVSGCGYLTVDPHFDVNKNEKDINDTVDSGWDLDGVVLQTYVSKNLGCFNEWESRLMTAKDGKYNMIHFTPLQELGYSGSAYSLRDQLKVNPNFTPPGSEKSVDWPEVEQFLKRLETDWSILCMTDLVFNHTSNDSPWLHAHPECAYNVVNSPHLVPAYLLDFIVWQLTLEAASGRLTSQGIPAVLQHPSTEIQAIRVWLTTQIERARLEEFFLVDIPTVQQEFISWLMSAKSSVDELSYTSESNLLVIKVAGVRKGRRFGGTVDFKLARELFVGVTDHSMPFTDAAATAASNRLKTKLEELNAIKRHEMADHLQVALNNIIANLHYRFYDPSGLRLGTVTLDTPIMLSYFYQPVSNVRELKDAEAVLNTPDAARVMAFNGWVMNDNPLRNFAEADSYVYLRRELIVWGDCVKLRYGKKREDCPFLWDRMADYAKLTARMFHAVRLDNCHSTPMHVAEYMLDCARHVRPNLYVVAELFTNSEYQDNVFINRLGLNSLIRESLQPHNAQSLGSHIYRFGVTRPTGAFFTHIANRRLYPSVAHALLYDQTHDNPSVAEKHCVYNYLPLTALTAIACCAIGSTRGYDELVPHNIDVVKEDRPYAKWPEQVNTNSGLVKVKSILNEMHTWLSSQGFTETFVDQCSPNVIAVTRISPESRESVVLVAHTAFNYDIVNQQGVDFKPIELGGNLNRLLLETCIVCESTVHPEDTFVKDPKYINGLKLVNFPSLENVDQGASRMFRVEHFANKGVPSDRLHFHSFPPGAVVVVSVKLSKLQEDALSDLHYLLNTQFTCSLHRPRASIKMGRGENAYTPHILSESSSHLEPNSLRALVSELNLLDLNRIMFRCEAEELSDSPPGGSYDVPGYGKLCFCGFQCISAVLEEICDKNDLGHPICAHLRNGDWLSQYLCERLCVLPKNSSNFLSPTLVGVGEILKQVFAPLRNLPRYLAPAYFAILVQLVTTLMKNETILQMASWLGSGSSLVQRLAIASNQFYGFIGNCCLPYPILSLPSNSVLLDKSPFYCSLAAGLPHFSEGMWRSWGRDTFIAFRGCFLLTGRFEDAANILLSYASLVRHGLIPNLTGEGVNVPPRYNCRDAVWYWLYAIICYEDTVAKCDRISNTTDTDNSDKQNNSHTSSVTSRSTGIQPTSSRSLLHRSVWRWFHTDDVSGWPKEVPERRLSLISMRTHVLHDIMQEVLQCHMSGIDFVERNSGPQLDEHMKSEGFNVTAYIDPQTGFPGGGNAFNCGTWMDKMGSSDSAHNRGNPATPRDGSAVELVGLAYAVVQWLNKVHLTANESTSSVYPHSGLQLPDGKFFTWKDWLYRLEDSFESAFWIPTDATDHALEYNRGIYRDSVGSSAGYTDNQLRPNFLVTMVVAPNLFTTERAWGALELVRERLVGPIGVRTLGPNDMAYRGDYHNTADTTDYATSKGFNYHQGPEWVWTMGYYIRARLYFARLLANNPAHQTLLNAAVSECQHIIARLDNELQSTPWRSLPELTNSNGQHCADSCASQAWSIACALEAAYDLLVPSI